MFNCRVVEGMLQESMGHLPLGQRLFRRSSAGAYTSIKQLEPDFVGKVFLTSFPITKGIDANGIMELNGIRTECRSKSGILTASTVSKSPSRLVAGS